MAQGIGIEHLDEVNTFELGSARSRSLAWRTTSACTRPPASTGSCSRAESVQRRKGDGSCPARIDAPQGAFFLHCIGPRDLFDHRFKDVGG